MWIVTDKLKIVATKVIDINNIAFENQFGKRTRFSIQLQIGLTCYQIETDKEQNHLFFKWFDMIGIDVGIADGVDEVTKF